MLLRGYGKMKYSLITMKKRKFFNNSGDCNVSMGIGTIYQR